MQDQMEWIQERIAGMRAAIADDDPLRASEFADELYGCNLIIERPAVRSRALGALKSANAPELYREALFRALVGSDESQMRAAVEGLATLIVILEPSPEGAHWLEILKALAKGECHNSLASSGERLPIIPPAASQAAREALARRHENGEAC